MRRQLAFRLVEKILPLARVRLSWQALRPIKWLLRRPFGVLAAARALIVRTLPAGSTRALPLDQHLAAERVAETEPLQGAAIARRFRRGNSIRHRGDPAAGTKSQRKCAGALSERAETRPLPIENLDTADMPIAVGIELDRRRNGGASRRHLDDTGRAADTERRLGRCVPRVTVALPVMLAT